MIDDDGVHPRSTEPVKEALERLHRNKVRPRLRTRNPKKAAMTIGLNLNLRRTTIRSHHL